MKFLKAVRLDDSDARVYAAEGGGARSGEWVVSGGYAVCDLTQGHSRSPCHCDSTFIAAGSRRRCTIAEVAEIDEHSYGAVRDTLAQHFIDELGAPSADAARAAADEECAYTADLAESFPPEVWITVKRDPSGDGVGERYSVYRRLMIGAHRL